MKLVTQPTPEQLKFLVKYRGIPNSGVTLDFQPTVERTGLVNEKDYILLHLRARPVNNKNLWTWGIFDGKNYHSLEHIDSNFGLFSSEISQENINNPPSHVLIIRNCNLSVNNNKGFLEIK